MRFETKTRVDRLIENRNIIKGGFKTSGRYKYLLGASYATSINQTIDIQKVHECKDYIK
ncbi:MAG: hypothetical protein GX802_05115, partial [Clostridiales bacterium]|nr:hypothetical protein [Clostridiales bacterium]